MDAPRRSFEPNMPSTRQISIMNRRSFLLLGAAALLVASAATAPAARLPVSTVTVEILSVDPQSYQRDEYRRETFKDGAVSSTWTEKTAVIAKARIKAVVTDDGHGLSPGRNHRHQLRS